MSNHSGSHMLNRHAQCLNESRTSPISDRRSEEFVGHVLALAWEYDGNPGEVLHGIGERGFCDTCYTPSDELDDGT